MSEDHDKATSCKPLLLPDNHLSHACKSCCVSTCDKLCWKITAHFHTFIIPACFTHKHFLVMMRRLLCLQATWQRLQARPSELHLATTLTPTCPAPAPPLPLHSAPVLLIRHQRRNHPCSSRLPAQPPFPPKELVLVLAQQLPAHQLWTQAFPPCSQVAQGGKLLLPPLKTQGNSIRYWQTKVLVWINQVQSMMMSTKNQQNQLQLHLDGEPRF